jgi:pantetheine-phosphate adenylyltransferase
MTNQVSKALYAFSADPITNGHVNIVERISKTFNQVIIAIGKNPSKNYTYSLEERMELAKEALSHLDNVEVVVAEGMLVDFAYSQGAQVIVKGVRNSADFDYEKMLHMVGESQKLGIDTHTLFADPLLSHVSSSTVKAIQKEHGDLHDYVPISVKVSLESKISDQVIIGISGAPACGKSTISEALIVRGAEMGLEVHNLELDYLGHQVLSDLTIPSHKNVTNNLIMKFGKDIIDINGEDDSFSMINRKSLAEIVFNDKKSLDYLNEQMKNPIAVLIRKYLANRKGLILFNGALLAEGGYLHYCNNRVILLDASESIQKDRMMKRGLNEDQIKVRLESQFTVDKKERIILEQIDKSKFGKVIVFDTSTGEVEEIADSILKDERIYPLIQGRR